jgi:hypothetical protein
MKDLNLELLNETYLRVVKLFKDYSNLNIFLKEILCGGILGKTTEIYILYKDEPHSKIVFKKDLYNSKIDNIYSFLFSHKFSYRFKYNDCSIFKYAENCRNYYQNYQDYFECSDFANDVGYELYSSEAGKLIKELGFPTCLEELIIKMDLIGI